MTLVEKIFSQIGNLFSSQIAIYTVIAILATFVLVKYLQWRQKMQLLARIPGPKGNFLFGQTLEMLNKTPREILRYLGDEITVYEGGISMIRIGLKPYVLIYKAAIAEEVLSSHVHITKDEDYFLLEPWLGTGLLLSTGSKWKSRRRMLTPAFHFKILESFVEVFSAKANLLASIFEKHQDDKEPFNIFPHVTNCTLDIILETAMGLTLNVQQNPNSEYVQAVLEMSDMAQRRVVNPFIRSDFMFWLLGHKKNQDNAIKILHDLSLNAISDRRADYKRRKMLSTGNEKESSKKRRLAFLDQLIETAEEEGTLTNEDIREEVDTFVFEGHDTTAAAVSFATYLIGCHPEIQQKVHEELDSIFEGSDRFATFDDLKKMNYLECCIKEALRLFPSVPFIERYIYEPMELGGYTIPSGTTLVISPYKMHQDPEHFPQPKKFIPDRFLPENSVGRHPFAFVPFSAGPRNCIGQKFALMEEKTVVSTIFRKFRLESVVHYRDLSVLGQLIMRPETAIDVRIFPKDTVTSKSL